MTPRTLLVLSEDDERALGLALMPYPARPAEAGILRPKRRFPIGGYLRPKGRFPPGGYLRPKGRFPSYTRGKPEPGKRERTLQKTQNSLPVHQEWEARPSTILHTLPREGEDTPNPRGERGKPSGRGVAEKTLDPEIQPLAKRGDLPPLGRGFAENPKNPGHGAKVGLPHCRPWEKPQPKGECSACPWECRTHTRWAMALCPISGSGEDQWRGGGRAIRHPRGRPGAPRPREARLREAPEPSPHGPTREYAKGMHKPPLFPSTGGRQGGTAREGLRGGTGGKADEESDDGEKEHERVTEG
jgi:hypothetical protein